LALNAMMEIALSQAPLSGRMLAERLRVPRRHLEPVLFALTGNGILRGVRGPAGGYELLHGAHLITVYDVLRAANFLEGLASPVPDGHLSHIAESVVMPAIAAAEQTFAAVLKSMSIEDLIRSRDRRSMEDDDRSALAAGRGRE
jgi:Rrf2 family protein